MDNGHGVELAWQRSPGREPCVVFLPGFRSDMTGAKATAIAATCAREGQAALLFDYSGHGQSGGRFDTGTISAWLDDALAVIGCLTRGPLILIGSSMGGWISLLVALARPDRIVGLIGVATAPDFVEKLVWQAMTFDEQTTLVEQGALSVANNYGEPYFITRVFVEDARKHSVLSGPINISVPVRLLHGQADRDVPWETSMMVAQKVFSVDVQVILIKDGEHRLSRPRDIALLTAVLLGLLKNCA